MAKNMDTRHQNSDGKYPNPPVYDDCVDYSEHSETANSYPQQDSYSDDRYLQHASHSGHHHSPHYNTSNRDDYASASASPPQPVYGHNQGYPPSSIPNRGEYSIPTRPSPLNGPYNQNPDIPSPYFNKPSQSTYTSHYNQPSHGYDTTTPQQPSQFESRVDNGHLRANPDIHHNQSNDNQRIQKETRVVYKANGEPVLVETESSYQDRKEKHFANHYMNWSLCNLIFCCMITGGIALGLSKRVRAANNDGQYQRARKLSRAALVMNILSVIGCLSIIAIAIAFGLPIYGRARLNRHILNSG